MNLEKLLADIFEIISEKIKKVFTGRVVFTINMKDGLIMNVDCEIKSKLK